MQGSFWKTVAVVGVIGIGSLAILEVQDRLAQETAGTELSPEDAKKLAEQIADNSETEVDAKLGQSEFERLLAGLDEPPASETNSATPKNGTEGGGQFYGSEIVAAQENTPPDFDTTVDVEKLSFGNPFQDEEARAVAASYQGGGDESVTTVGFEEKETPNPFDELISPSDAAEANSQQLKPFQRESDLKSTPETTTEKEEASLNLFAEDSAGSKVTLDDPGFDDTAPGASNKNETSLPDANSASSSAPGFKFFGSDPDAQPTTSQDSQERTTAQVSQQKSLPLQPTPDAANDSLFNDDTPSFDESEETPGSLPDGFAPFDEPLVKDDTLKPTPEAFSDVDPDQDTTSPFQEDYVPTPKMPQPLPESNLLNVPRPRSDDISPKAISSGTTQQRSNSQLREEDTSLPFAEDIDPPSNSAPIDTFDQPSLSIPRREDSYDNSPSRTRNDLGAESFRDRAEDSVQPLDMPRPYNRNQPARDIDDRSNLRDGSRQFNAGSRQFDSSSNNFDSGQIDVQPGRVPQRDFRRVAGVMRPNLVLQKTAPENATVGTPLDYKIHVSNEGDATAFDVVVEDEVTAGATVNGAHPQSEIDRKTNKLIWRFTRVDPGETKEITVQVTPTGEGTLDGVATVRFKARVKATTVITAPKLQLQMQGPDQVRLGEEVAYRYIITNKGSGEARDVFVRTVLPVSGGLKHPAGNDLEYKIDALKPAEQREITLSVIAAEPGEYRAEAEVTAAGGAKDQAAWRTEIIGAQLKIVRRGPKKRFVGRSATYENIVSNETNFEALDARVVEKVPVGMKFLSANLGARYDEAGRTVTWNINRIGAGNHETLQIELMPVTAGSPESIVTVFENAGIRGDHVSTTVVEDLHNVSADISQLDGPIARGETFGFTISVDNRGTADATDVSLSVEVPDEIQVVGAGSREVQAKLMEGNVVQYNIIVRIPPNSQKDFELKLKGLREVQNAAVKASVRYAQMEKPLVVSESVTVYESL